MRSFEDDLRRMLDAEAATVEVRPDSLPEIRRRIAARRARWSPRLFVAGSGALALAASVVAVFIGVGSCVPRPAPGPPIAGPSSAAPTLTQPPTTPSGTAAGPGTTGLLPVYYLGQDRGKPRLYREFHQLPAGDGSAAAKTRAAVGEMLGRTAYDPDYSSPWPPGAAVRDVRISGNLVTVDLSGAGTNNVGSEVAHQAVQQLIWTATAVSNADAVRILLNGQRVAELWGHVAVSLDLRRGPYLDVVALVWLYEPQQGAAVGRSFELLLQGVVYEATVNIRVRQGANTVTETFATLNNGAPAVGQGRVPLNLAPGKYTIEAYEISAADGSEQHLDDHEITVR